MIMLALSFYLSTYTFPWICHENLVVQPWVPAEPSPIHFYIPFWRKDHCISDLLSVENFSHWPTSAMKMSSPDHYPDGTSVVEDRHLQVLPACRLPSTRAHGNAPPLTEHGAPVQVAVDQGLKLLPYPTKPDQEGSACCCQWNRIMGDISWGTLTPSRERREAAAVVRGRHRVVAG